MSVKTETYTTKTVTLGPEKKLFTFRGMRNEDKYLAQLQDGGEPGFAAFCSHFVKSHHIAFDVGANIGLTASMLSTSISAGRIHAFEAGPSVFAVLTENIRANNLSNVRPHHCAASDKDGVLRFHEDSAYGHIELTGAGIDVEARTIDSLVRSIAPPRVDVIKIDIEGFEWHALRGATDTIKAFKPLIYIEFNSWCQIAYSRTNPADFLDWIFASFSDVYLAPKISGEDVERLDICDLLSILHTNIIRHGCVDDLILVP